MINITLKIKSMFLSRTIAFTHLCATNPSNDYALVFELDTGQTIIINKTPPPGTPKQSTSVNSTTLMTFNHPNIFLNDYSVLAELSDIGTINSESTTG